MNRLQVQQIMGALRPTHRRLLDRACRTQAPTGCSKRQHTSCQLRVPLNAQYVSVTEALTWTYSCCWTYFCCEVCSAMCQESCDESRGAAQLATPQGSWSPCADSHRPDPSGAPKQAWRQHQGGGTILQRNGSNSFQTSCSHPLSIRSAVCGVPL